MKSKFALIGLPNVGKSSFFNSIVGRKLSITYEEANTTVDYITYNFIREEKVIQLIDTAGINSTKDLSTKAGEFILSSDVIIYMIDATVGLTNQDEEILKALRRKNKDIIYVVNKVDLKEEIEDLKGIKEYFKVSSLKNIGIDNFKDKVIGFNKEKEDILIGIIGKCNVGKSTLMNSLLKLDRVLTSPVAGTTIDSIIDKKEGSQIAFMDTAGYKNINDTLDPLISKRREYSLKEVKGVIIVLDGSTIIEKIDKKVIEEGQKYGSFMIVAFNKKELITPFEEENFKYLHLPPWIPTLHISAKNNQLGNLFPILRSCIKSAKCCIKTNALNKWWKKSYLNIRDINGKIMSIKYLVQISSDPIIIKYFGTSAMSESSQKHFKKEFTKEFSLIGCNISLLKG